MLATLKSVPLFAGLPEELLAALSSSVTVRRFPRSTFILHAGEKADGLYVILTGSAKVLIPAGEGREFILARIGPRECFGDMGVLDGGPRSASVKTLQSTELMCISKADFMRCLSDNFELAMRIIRALVKRLHEANRQIASLALMDVPSRVLRVLRDLAENVDGTRIVRKAPSKQEIAYIVGATRERVSRVMKELENSGQIRIDKRCIVLLGPPRRALR